MSEKSARRDSRDPALVGEERNEKDLTEDAEAAAPTRAGADDDYTFRDETAGLAVELLDLAAEGKTDRHEIIDALRSHAQAAGLSEDDPLIHELVRFWRYRLEFGRPGSPGCDLVPDWGVASGAASEDTRRLWRFIAANASEVGARARAADLLWLVKDGKAGVHARAAARDYVVVAASTDPVTLGSAAAATRAWDLARRVGADDFMPKVRETLLSTARRQLDSGEYAPGIVLPLLSAAAATPSEGSVSTTSADPLDQMLDEVLPLYRSDYLLEETATLLASRDPSEAARVAVRRRQVHQLLNDARRSVGLARQVHLTTVIETARRYGIRDLEDEATRELQRIRPEQLELHRIETGVQIPADQIERYVARFGLGRDWRDGLMLFLASTPPTGSLSDLKAQAADHVKNSIARVIATRVQLTGAGLPTYTVPQDDNAADLAFVAQFSAAIHGEMLAAGLDHLVERFGTPDIRDVEDYLAALGASDAALARSLAKGLAHFWAGDYDSAVHLVVPKIETALRAMLREADVATFRIQVGRDPGGYVGLYPLLTALEERSLDPDWAYFLRWLLTGPPNRNLRNDIAHGLLAGCGRGTAALALRAAALVILIAGPTTPEGWEPDADGPPATAGETTILLRTPAELMDVLKAPLPEAGRAGPPPRRPVRIAARALRRMSLGAHRGAMWLEDTEWSARQGR